MKLTATGLCVAAAFAFAASLGAQTATTAPQHTSSDEVSITGCLERGPSGGFMLSNAKMETDMSRTGAAGTTGTTGATSGTTAGMAATAGSTWTLEGESSDLEKHVGHKITVTGKAKDHAGMGGAAATTTTGTSGTTATGAAAATQRLDVKSVKMVSTTCP